MHVRTSAHSRHHAHIPVALTDESTVACLFVIPNDLVHRCVADPIGDGFLFPTGKIQLYDIATNKTWSKMEDLPGASKVRAIDGSNFSTKM